ncbi:MAG TPA: glycosyltransferase, partial [Chitinophagaceae bacterium]
FMQPVVQIFQTDNPSRWNKFKWTFRVLAIIGLFFVAVAAVALINATSPSLPKDKNEIYKKILNPNNPIIFKNHKNKRFQSFRQFINYKDKGKQPRNFYKNVRKRRVRLKPVAPVAVPDSQIRAAFYVPWDPQSLTSLKNSAGQINVVLPEWIFLNPHNDSLETRIDGRALKIMQDSTVSIIPMLTNHYDPDTYDGKAVHRILHDKAKRTALINQLAGILIKNKFQGVNVDFEELVENNNSYLVEFQKELYEKLHPLGLVVSIDVSVFDEDYDYGALADYSDYLFVMAYDQHSNDSDPGPLNDQHWIEGALADITKNVPDKKIVLAIAGYGYDWPKGAQAEDLTYQEAIVRAKQNNAHIYFDSSTYNLHYSYTDDNDESHEVYFTDAATNFNTMRFAAEGGMAGVALWRLGSEDSRLWSFYARDLSDTGLKKHPVDFSRLENVAPSGDVDFIGDGEILDVLATPEKGKIRLKVDSADMLITGQQYITLPSMYVIRQFGRATMKKVLTFDDGPDPKYTPRILKILEKEHVPAAFFMVGINAQDNIPLVKRIYNEGFEIGNHTFTHPNIAALPPRLADMEIKSTRLLIECITGHSTTLFRAPYNADAEPHKPVELIPIALAKKQNYYTINENIDPEDWDTEDGVNADTIFNRVVRFQHAGNIILLHDAGGNREATVEALPRIIHYLRAQGYTFTTVADLMGKTRDEIMPPVSDKKDYYLIKINYWFASFTYWFNHLLFALFVVGIGLSIGRIIVLAVIAYMEDRRTKREKINQAAIALPVKDYPLVSIIVPAYNEEVNTTKTIQALLKSDYPNVEVIFVDDGSQDNTYRNANEEFKADPRVKVLTKPNGGKASALNYGINISTGDYLLCIDADTQLKTDAISRLMEMFTSEKVGAVAGNVKVGNEVNVLTEWQSIEYITSQNFDRRAFDLLNCITVVPGAIGAFRKAAIFKAGGFTSDTLAEDCDLTIRILRCGYVIRNCTAAISYTEAPETMKMFFRQRFRWSFGVMQSFWKHRDACFNRNYKNLGMIALPNILIYQILLPLLAPLADIIMLLGLFTGSAGRIFVYYLIFMLVDAAAAVLAFSFEKEKF